MKETCTLAPSELHLKKELTTIGKSRPLRDPGTHMSWKSPLNSTSFHMDSNLTNETPQNKVDRNGLAGSSALDSGLEKRRKKVYLYNWGHRSSKSSDTGFVLDEGKKQTSVPSSPENIRNGAAENISNGAAKLDSGRDAYLEDPGSIGCVEVNYLENSVRKTARRPSRGVSLRKINRKNSAVKKMLAHASNSRKTLKHSEQSDDSGYFSSEDLQEKHRLTRGAGYCSQCASPIVSGLANNWSKSSNFVRGSVRDCSSFPCTPTSNNSINRCFGHMPSTGRSWYRTSASFSEDELNSNRICGLPFNLSKRTDDTCSKTCSSGSVSDTPRKMVGKVVCGSRTVHRKRRTSTAYKRNRSLRSSQGASLLKNSYDGVVACQGLATDELATNFEELDLEAVNRLDGRRWSSCRSQEGSDLGLHERVNSLMAEENSLSQKYRPKFFHEIVGQNIVVQSLKSAICKGRIAPAYLFLGPHGSGKLSVARVFATALNCLSTEENRPCGLCSECSMFVSGVRLDMKEVDARNKKDVGKIRLLLKNTANGTDFSRYKVFIIHECHMLSSRSWSAFMNFLEEPLSHVIFIFITIDPDSLPRVVSTRCQRYFFPKLKDADISLRLRKISAEENLDVDWDALDLIASNSDGSLHDAEKMLDQLTLLGKRITTSFVNDLVGVVSDEQLLKLLEVALSSDTAETVKLSRALMESGVDPVVLMSQLAGLIMDIIAGTYSLPKSVPSSPILSGKSLTEVDMQRLQQILKVLSNAEKQLQLSSERSTWFTAALLQIGSVHSPQTTSSRSSSLLSTKRLDEYTLEKIRETSPSGRKFNSSLRLYESGPSSIPGVSGGCNRVCVPRSIADVARKDDAASVMVPRSMNPDNLDAIWKRCIEICDSEELKHLLYAHGKLISITETKKGVLVAYIAFGDGNVKLRAESFLRSIRDSMAIVLKHNVEIRIGLVPEKYSKALRSLPDSSSGRCSDSTKCLDNIEKSNPRSADHSESKLQTAQEMIDPSMLPKARKTAISEQRLENAWLHAAESTNSQNQVSSLPDLSISFKQWGDRMSSDTGFVETYDGDERYHYAVSPSVLHSSNSKTFDQESLSYDSRPGRSAFCCWRRKKPENRRDQKRR